MKGFGIFTVFLFCLLTGNDLSVSAQLDQAALIEKEKAIAAVHEKQIVVEYEKAVTHTRKKAVRQAVSDASVQVKAVNPTVDVITLSNKKHIPAVLTELKNQKNVKYAEPNTVIRTVQSFNDPKLGEQWWIDEMHVPAAWHYAEDQKKNIVIAVIDSGVNMEHEELKNRLAPGAYDFFNETEEMQDLVNHGTSVAGAAAAEAGNGIALPAQQVIFT